MDVIRRWSLRPEVFLISYWLLSEHRELRRLGVVSRSRSRHSLSHGALRASALFAPYLDLIRVREYWND